MVTQRVDERFVARIWEGHLVPDHLLSALELEIVHPGMPSDAGGPDYQDALVCWGGRFLIGGDVEFHVRASDWYRHRHHVNQAYNNVVLHVVWENDAPEIRRQNGQVVPTLELRLEPAFMDLLKRAAHQLDLCDHPCSVRCRSFSVDEIWRRVRVAGLSRLHERSEHLENEMMISTPDQVTYAAMLEAMGYASNRETFRQLADILPFSWLQSMPAPEWKDALISSSGLHPPSIDVPGHLDPASWRLARLRPGNHPARRLAGLATLLARFGPHLAERMSEQVLACEHRGTLRTLFTVRLEAETLIGPGRADEMVASCVLPLALALTEQNAVVEELYSAYYGPPSTRWTRALSASLQRDARRFVPRTASEHQGFHLIYTRHCRHDRQAGCPLCGDVDG